MTKKKKSILSDQRFVVLLVIIALSAVFSFMSKEFRQYTTILSMLDFSYYDLLMANSDVQGPLMRRTLQGKKAREEQQPVTLAQEGREVPAF